MQFSVYLPHYHSFAKICKKRRENKNKTEKRAWSSVEKKEMVKSVATGIPGILTWVSPSSNVTLQAVTCTILLLYSVQHANPPSYSSSSNLGDLLDCSAVSSLSSICSRAVSCWSAVVVVVRAVLVDPRRPGGLVLPRGTLALALEALEGGSGPRWASICYGSRQVSLWTRLLGSTAMAKS